jgi:hypothetical protein
MRDYVEDFVAIYEEVTGKPATVFPCPGYPSTVLSKNNGDIVKQTEYRQLVGKISFAVKKCVPDCANAVCDLCGHLESPGDEHWKALGRLVGDLKANYRPLKLRCPKELRDMRAVDSDWGTSTVDLKSIGAYLSGVGGFLYNWQSKKKTGVALSSTEAELASASELGKDIKFLRSLIDEVTGGQAVMPSHISEDNTGAIFLMKKNGVSSRTKHIDIRGRFLHDMVESGELEVDHCPGKFTTPDTITKNTPEAVHRVHTDTMYNGHILPPAYNRSSREDVNIVLEVLDNEHSLMCPTDRGNDQTVERDESERVDRESSNRDGNGPLHDHQWTLVQNPRRAWK